MSRKRTKQPEVTVCVGGYDVSGDVRHPWTADELLLVARVLKRGAAAIKNGEHGTVESVRNLASVGVDQGGPFDDDMGLPVLVKFRATDQ